MKPVYGRDKISTQRIAEKRTARDRVEVQRHLESLELENPSVIRCACGRAPCPLSGDQVQWPSGVITSADKWRDHPDRADLVSALSHVDLRVLTNEVCLRLLLSEHRAARKARKRSGLTFLRMLTASLVAPGLREEDLR